MKRFRMMKNENLNSDEFECCIKNVNRGSRFFKLTRNKERLVILDAFILFSGIALQHCSRNLALSIEIKYIIIQGENYFVCSTNTCVHYICTLTTRPTDLSSFASR